MNHVSGCPGCGSRIPFKRFVMLHNFSAINCGVCNARIEIANRGGNAMIAAFSGILSALSVVFCSYWSINYFNSIIPGLAGGLFIACIMVLVICRIIYKRSRLRTWNTETEKTETDRILSISHTVML
ncbi:hypothetical protein [Sediminibacterium ginsengisoli]|uniref:Uncharacterized protein n=1 Tax=Sediminibacterium ginsengisoli TaxID=413434 RepID=A0A1T4JXZ9_9BACT|nr:hypothetical protein [Sediminibacterium ginsengisoli]SJZ35033.1 hypothetical protein SAMN04488132_101301 [Sediminibacterium ginsengisoli]